MKSQKKAIHQHVRFHFLKMNKIEILSPCGGFEAVEAAVRCGADAVYLGATEFSARASADNFDFAQLKGAVEYCHIRGVLVYLTLNTLVFDTELERAAQVITEAAKAGVDALIVQNIGVAMLAKRLVPDLRLHGSTQMSVHTPGGAKLLYEMGFKRVVLSRELSREEIKEIADSCPIELEVFVHGALCMSVSGQCCFSAVLGSRSGNRGRCAQPCRLPFSVGDKKGFALSLKDNSLVDYIRDLQEIGVCSAKIEGRMKRPEYVAAATSACVQQRDNGFIDSKIREQLEGVFSRTGFTDGYYKSKRGYEMFGYRRKDDVVSATDKLLSQIRQSYKNEKNRVKITGKFQAKIGENPTFFVSDGIYEISVKSEIAVEKAINCPLEENRCKEQLQKTGGTPYFFEKLEAFVEKNSKIPLSELNNLRRKALSELSEKRKITHNYTINSCEELSFTPYAESKKGQKSSKKLLYTRVTSAKLGEGFKESDLIFVPIFSDLEEIKRLKSRGFKIGAEIPRALFSREKKAIERLKMVKELGVCDVLCNNLGAVYIAKELGLTVHGGFGLNFVNTLDLQWAEDMGFSDTELSFELKLEQIEALGGNIPRGIISYGYLPLMLTRNCPNKSKNISCKICKNQGKMTDRMNKSFIFYCDGCGVEILNSAVLDVRNYSQNLLATDFEVFRFSVENSVENVEKLADFIRNNLKKQTKTHGLYLRGIF